MRLSILKMLFGITDLGMLVNYRQLGFFLRRRLDCATFFQLRRRDHRAGVMLTVLIGIMPFDIYKASSNRRYNIDVIRLGEKLIIVANVL